MWLWTVVYVVEALPPHLYDFKNNWPYICSGLWSGISVPRWVCHVYLWNGIKVSDWVWNHGRASPADVCVCCFPPSLCSGTFPPRYIHDVSFKQPPRFSSPPAGMQQRQIPSTLMVIVPAEIFCACSSALQEQTVASQHLTKQSLEETKLLWWLNSFGVKALLPFQLHVQIQNPTSHYYTQVQHLSSWKQHSAPLESFSHHPLASPREQLIFCVSIFFETHNITV